MVTYESALNGCLGSSLGSGIGCLLGQSTGTASTISDPYNLSGATWTSNAAVYVNDCYNVSISSSSLAEQQAVALQHATWDAWNTVGGITVQEDSWLQWNGTYWAQTAERIAYPWRQREVTLRTVQPSAEEIEEATRRAQERVREADQRANLRRTADSRAEALLQTCLNEEQAKEFRQFQYFTVISKDGQRRYRIRKGIAGNILRIDGAGKPTHTLCAHPAEEVPEYDNMLAQKLWLEHDEASFLKVANMRMIA